MYISPYSFDLGRGGGHAGAAARDALLGKRSLDNNNKYKYHNTHNHNTTTTTNNNENHDANEHKQLYN